MSERGSFTTSYINCDVCFGIVRDHLILDGNKYLASTQIPSWESGKLLPIIAGKIGALHSNGEIIQMEEIAAEISPKLCHDVRIAILCDAGIAKVIRIGTASKPDTAQVKAHAVLAEVCERWRRSLFIDGPTEHLHCHECLSVAKLLRESP